MLDRSKGKGRLQRLSKVRSTAPPKAFALYLEMQTWQKTAMPEVYSKYRYLYGECVKSLAETHNPLKNRYLETPLKTNLKNRKYLQIMCIKLQIAPTLKSGIKSKWKMYI
jgi:hypothetical protein